MTHPPPIPEPAVPAGKIQIDGSYFDRALDGDLHATSMMFRQFLGTDEEVVFSEYLGSRGLWIFKRHSFGCLTSRRVASMMMKRTGELIYQDGYLESVNSTVLYQPSVWKLYLLIGMTIFLSLFTSVWILDRASRFSDSVPIGAALLSLFVLVLGGLLVMVLPSLYFSHVKCGLVVVIREGVSVYMFANRGRLSRANAMLRTISRVRDHRLGL